MHRGLFAPQLSDSQSISRRQVQGDGTYLITGRCLSKGFLFLLGWSEGKDLSDHLEPRSMPTPEGNHLESRRMPRPVVMISLIRNRYCRIAAGRHWMG